MHALERRIALAALLSMALSASAAAQTSAPDDADAHLTRGRELEQKADYRGARSEFEIALSAFEARGDTPQVINTERHLAAVLTLTGDFGRARTLLHQALTTAEETGDRRAQAGVLFEMSGDAPLPIDEREAPLIRAEAIAEELGDTRLLATIAHRSGDFAYTRGDFARAIERVQRAIDLYEADGAAQEQLARALTSLGRIHRAHGHPELALDLYRRALRIQIEVGDQQGAIQSTNATGVALDALGRADEAIDAYRRALALARETGSPRLVAFQLGNLGGSYLASGDFAKAVPLLKEALDRSHERYLMVIRGLQLAWAYIGLHRYAEALSTSERTVADARAEDMREQLVSALGGKAEALRALGRPAEALAVQREALASLEELRKRLVPTDFMKRGFGKEYDKVIVGTIDLLHAVQHDDEALETAERARGRALLDLLASRGLQDVAPTDVSTANEVQLTLRGGRTAGLSSPASETPISKDELRETARRLQSTLIVYYVARDALYIWTIDGARAAVHGVKVAATSTRLRELVNASQPQLFNAPRAATAAALVPRSASAIVSPVATPRAPLRELERLLIEPVRAYLPRSPGARITIVPHGPLFLLSFAALIDGGGRYLLERYTLTYAPSVAVLRFTAEHARQAAERPTRYLFVADPSQLPAMPNAEPLPPLPGARREVAAITRRLPRDVSSTLAGPDALEATVRARIADATVIHLATHGIAGGPDPLDGFIALGRSDDSREETDGRLTAAEVYRLELHADLVVLSACRTLVASENDDGLAGLTRAFLSAGAASIVATIWDVADETTVRLMPAFYDLRAGGGNKAEALRGAQLRLLRDLRAGRVTIRSVRLAEDPFFWAGFILVGEP